jgi:hypothetical protein
VVITNANNDGLLIRDLLLEHIPQPLPCGGNEGQNCIATAQVTITQPEILVSVSGIATNATCLVKLMGRLL